MFEGWRWKENLAWRQRGWRKVKGHERGRLGEERGCWQERWSGG